MAGRKLELAARELRGHAEQAVQNAAASGAWGAGCSKGGLAATEPKAKVGTSTSLS